MILISCDTPIFHTSCLRYLPTTAEKNAFHQPLDWCRQANNYPRDLASKILRKFPAPKKNKGECSEPRNPWNKPRKPKQENRQTKQASWWLNQPIWTFLLVKKVISFQRDPMSKWNIFWNHHLSHEKNPLTFHYAAGLIGILAMVYYTPYRTG